MVPTTARSAARSSAIFALTRHSDKGRNDEESAAPGFDQDLVAGKMDVYA
jgi:hypothetical protein